MQMQQYPNPSYVCTSGKTRLLCKMLCSAEFENRFTNRFWTFQLPPAFVVTLPRCVTYRHSVHGFAVECFRFSGNTAGVRNVTVKPSLPCDKAKISLWEQRNACQLPDDVRAFYASCDGFKLTWSYKVEGESAVAPRRDAGRATRPDEIIICS